MVATAYTFVLEGAVGHLIEVQVDISPGVVGATIVGRPDASLLEARDRVRMAITHGAPPWPSTRRVTILLAPGDLPKRGTHFDLAIALGIKAADGGVPKEALSGTVLIGELGLDGRLRPVAGVLPMVMAAARRGFRRVFVPEPQAREAAMVPGLEVFGVRSLAQVVAQLRGEEVPVAEPVTGPSGSQLLSWRGEDRCDALDMTDLIGMEDAKFAVEVAAAGGHHLLLSGPKGAGKTSLAERIPGILPDLGRDESLELTAVRSLSGPLDPVDGPCTRPPFRAPHHDASRTSILGGGSGRVRPGELSRAHGGVLFLDEFPLFRADVIDGLRQPLESGEVRVVRGEEAAVFPAGGMVVLAANPCPCGEYHPSAGQNRCDCPEVVRRDYRRKVSGPVTDRIDITRHVAPTGPRGRDPLERREGSAEIRERVAGARERQAERYAGLAWRLNGQVPGHVLREEWPLPDDGRRRLDDALLAGRLTRRGATRVHRVAWSLADLRGTGGPTDADVDAALRLRSGDPLPGRLTAAR
ncbi:YifB family Mg chelatase-like AAA ATPase [Nocardioides solisilvae]|uniref:YifB family Mg chelatase-like AAA ATPase n=1 Tax=Nocardioides solisilvae TaxID=1542435 RepID=UPI001EF6D12D|nr:YifB family Mg chelatase-like AAA ATPase [Nocardioides solisilvae]